MVNKKTQITVNAASGKMAQQVISQVVNHAKTELVGAICRPKHRLLGRTLTHTQVKYTSDLPQALELSNVVIDFSLPKVSLNLIEQAKKTLTPLLIGTTGFNAKELASIKQASRRIPILLTPNTSIGVNSAIALLSMAAKLLGKQADIEIIETHHRHKIDAPSGTAIRMGETIAQAMGKNFEEIKVTSERFKKVARKKGEIGLSSIRAGEVIGDHKIIFALDNEVISIEHSAQNRLCFAEGAVAAAIWLAEQKKGLYSMQDFIAAN